MAQSELTQSEYSSLKSALGTLSDNKAASEYHVGKRRVAMVRRSKSYAGYLQIRRNEARKAAENRPAKAVPGTSELPNENAEFLAQTDDGKSLPAEQTKTDSKGTHDARPQAEQDADEQRKADQAKEAEARALNREYQRRENRRNLASNLFTLAVLGFAIVGIIAVVVWIVSLF